MKLSVVFGALAIAAAPLCTAHAASPFSADLNVGTTGVGLEGQYRLNDYLAVRASGDWIGLNHDFSSSDLSYRGSAHWETVGGFVDLHPFKNGFLLSGGAYAGDRKVTLDATPRANVSVNGVPLTPAQVGELQGQGKLSSTAPFVGVGWDGTFNSKGGLGFRALLGVAFSGDPTISLTATGSAANTPAIRSYVQTYLQQQEDQVRRDARFLKTYPVANIGVGYRF
jgi:hypothetical protein